MPSPKHLLSSLRAEKFELHCLNIKIWQEGGTELLGHGIIKINKHGVLYLEFICITTNIPTITLSKNIPENEMFHLEFETLNGYLFKASNVSVELSSDDNYPPKKKSISLNNIFCENIVDCDSDNSLYFEFSEHCDIPANKSNSVTSSYGYESYTKNESTIEMKGFKISIIDMKEYKRCCVTGVFDVERVYECLKFYIGFACGSMIQPSIKVQRVKTSQLIKINSINNIQKYQRSTTPLPSKYGKAALETYYHYQMFKNIYDLYETTPRYFDSIYNQWTRVWYSFQSKNSITILTLSVAIEGLLNDIFIPKFKSAGINNHLDEEISKIKLLVSKLDISDQQIDRLKNSISYWKNITASSSLKYLVNINIITIEQKRSWDKLRNSSAHPTTKEVSVKSLEQENRNLSHCLDLFHTLVFQTLKYSGPRYYIALTNEDSLKLFEYIDIDKS